MKTHLFLIGTVSMLGTLLLTTSYAASTSEYLHFTRHRDSNGNLLMAPTQHQAEPSVIQKTVMPSQPRTFERRSTDWGMSVQEVKENEPVQFSWDLQSPVLADYEKRVAYHTQIEGIEATLTYTFYEDHLGRAKYVFESQHDDAVASVQDFHTVKNWISQSYGSPTSVQEIWLDTLYRYDASLWGQAVKRRHLVMVGEWKNPGTDIVLMLDGGNDEVGLVADFMSTTFVVPVSLDMQGQEESVQTVIKETTIQESLPTKPATDSMAEEVQGQDVSLENQGSIESQTETEVASQTPVNEIQELEEIEQMLNEEYPLDEPLEPSMQEGSVESSLQEPMSEETTLEAVPDTHAAVNSEGRDHDMIDPHPMHEGHLMNEDMSQNCLIEPSSNPQVLEGAMEVPPAESSQAESTEIHPKNDYSDDHAMEVEEELDPQHL